MLDLYETIWIQRPIEEACGQREDHIKLRSTCGPGTAPDVWAGTCGGVVRTRIWIRPTGSRPDGEREGLLEWVKVCVTNKSEVELHMLDRELLSAFGVFLGNLPRKEELSALVGWRMVYSIMQVLAAEGSTIGEVLRKASPGGNVWHPTGLLPSVQAMYDGHSHLDRWSVEVG